MMYNWQLPDWPDFKYNLQAIEDDFLSFVEEAGYVSGMLNAMPKDAQLEAIINMLVVEAMKTSEIEGEYLSQEDIISSIRNQLGLNEERKPVKDKKAEGIGELMVDVRNTYADELTETKLFDWHRMLLKQSRGISVGAWRKGEAPMQIVSGTIGNETVHFEAPPSARVPEEMTRFIQWFNDTAPGMPNAIKKAPVRAAIAHLYFESIHPFEDGNGRVGRAIAEKALSQTVGRPVLLSLSPIIESNRNAYYNALKNAQHSNEITKWINYFVGVTMKAQQGTKRLIDFILRKAKFYDHFRNMLNERQLKVINRMLEAGPEGFEGGMSAKKYVAITKTSPATATRDLQILADAGGFTVRGGGRSTRYTLNLT
jgi:Fic family protein